MKFFQSAGKNIGVITPWLQSRQIALLAFGLVFVIIMTACAAGSSSANPLANTQAESQDNVEAENSETAENAELGLEEFGFSMEELVAKVEAVESLIASCMNEAGFEYLPVDFNTVRRGMLADKSLPGLAEREFKSQYGFGISTLYADVDVPQLANETNPARIGLGDQNVQIYKNLSPADQVAYNRTLLGENADATFAVTFEAEDFSRTGGCTRNAIEQVFTSEELGVTYLNPRDALYLEDPRMIAALKEYAECVREKGYDYATPEEVEPDIEERFEAITGGVSLGTLSAEAKAALTELQEEERAIAVASFDCEHSIIHPVQDQLDNE
jgi:hypothetical protein